MSARGASILEAERIFEGAHICSLLWNKQFLQSNTEKQVAENMRVPICSRSVALCGA